MRADRRARGPRRRQEPSTPTSTSPRRSSRRSPGTAPGKASGARAQNQFPCESWYGDRPRRRGTGSASCGSRAPQDRRHRRRRGRDARAEHADGARLERIHSPLADLIDWHEPAAMALEDIYFGKNVHSAMARRPGQRRGDARRGPARRALASTTRPRRSSRPSADPARAAKEQVQRMVGTLLGLPEPPTPTTPPMPSRWRSATAAPPDAGGDAGSRQETARWPGWRPDDRLRRAARSWCAGPTTSWSRPAASATGSPSPPRRLQAVPAIGARVSLHAAADRPRGLAGALSASPPRRSATSSASLISVSGVGPKVAIAALSGGPPRELLRAIAAGDAKRFQAVPGIGKRTAERIIVELREKVAGPSSDEVTGSRRTASRRAAPPRPRRPDQPRLRAAARPSSCSKASMAKTPEQLLAAALRKAGASRSKPMSDRIRTHRDRRALPAWR